MGVLIDFRKVREDKQGVEYTLGYPTMDRRLVIKLSTGEGRPIEGEADTSFHSVLRKIRRGRESLGRWPETGAYSA